MYSACQIMSDVQVLEMTMMKSQLMLLRWSAMICKAAWHGDR